MSDWTYAATHACEFCGRTVKTGPQGRVRPAWLHACRFRWLSRRLDRAYHEGWHSGYRFAAEHPDDPLVAADRDDYGSGWAAHMRAGGVVIYADGEATP